MDSKLQPVQLYGFSKSRLYEPLGTAIFFRNRFCPVSWILVFLPVHFYGYSLFFYAVFNLRNLLYIIVAAAFLWPDTEKALKSRAFGQNEKVGNFYQNYLPFVAESKGFEPLWACALTVFKTAPL